MVETPESVWSENRVHRLRELIANAFSASQAADALSSETGAAITRSMALAKAKTIGLTFQGRRGRPSSNGAFDARTEGPRAGLSRAHRAGFSQFDRHPVPLPIDDLRLIPACGPALPFISKPEHSCSWPVLNRADWLGETGQSTPVCCGDAMPGKSYCPAHQRLAYQAA